MGKTKTVLVGEKEEKKEEKKEKILTKIPGLRGGQRIRAVEVEPLSTETKEEIPQRKKGRKKERSKKYKEAKSKITNKEYEIEEAIKLLKEVSYTKFDGTVELHLVLKKGGINKNISLPHFFGKEKKVEIATEDTIEKIKKGKIDFDVLLATPEMMPKLIPFAKILGPKGLMPNPKNKTLIKSEKEAKDFQKNTITLKTEKEQPLLHTIAGKVSMKEKEIKENIEEIIEAIGKRQIVKAYLSATMSPSIKLKI